MSRKPFSCRLILSKPAGGAMNMALDEALLECVGDEAVLRVYPWARPTLSLGYFQAAAERESHEASRVCDLVRRPSGGGAILHDRELTYCFVLPEALAKTQPHTLWYLAVHRALIASLEELTGVSGTFSLCHNPPEVPEREMPFLCFQRRAEGDLLCGKHKIAGSAQRRRGGAILQHGSVLLECSPHAPELPGIRELTDRQISFDELSAVFAREAFKGLSFDGRVGEPYEHEILKAENLSHSKYLESTWTLRR
jgi:lipoate-protein ligase A